MFACCRRVNEPESSSPPSLIEFDTQPKRKRRNNTFKSTRLFSPSYSLLIQNLTKPVCRCSIVGSFNIDHVRFDKFLLLGLYSFDDEIVLFNQKVKQLLSSQPLEIQHQHQQQDVIHDLSSSSSLNTTGAIYASTTTTSSSSSINDNNYHHRRQFIEANNMTGETLLQIANKLVRINHRHEMDENTPNVSIIGRHLQCPSKETTLYWHGIYIFSPLTTNTRSAGFMKINKFALDQ